MIIITFGLPGAGKSYVAQILKKYYGFYYFEGDSQLTEEMKQALEKKEIFTDEMRNEFFQKLLLALSTLSQKYYNLVIAQTFIKETYRQKVLNQFPSARFMLITAPAEIRTTRLGKRKELPLSPEYVEKMNTFFEEPKIPHLVIENNKDGEDAIKTQLKAIFEKIGLT